MKKTFMLVITFILSITLIGCVNDNTKYQVIVPNGNPLLAQVHVQDKYNMFKSTNVDGAEPLQSAFIKKNYDFIIAPTNLGVKFYNEFNDYLLAATVVLGGSYLASINTKLNSIEDIKNKTIYAYGKNQTGDAVLQFILKQLNINVEIEYLSSVADASVYLLTNKDSIILTAEPTLTNLKLKHSNLSVIDLQDLYENLTGYESYPQASLFVKKDLNKTIIDKYLKALNESVNKVNSNPKLTSEIANKLGYEISKEVLELSIEKSNIKFILAKEAKAMIVNYLELLDSFNSNLITKVPDDEFYYIS